MEIDVKIYQLFILSFTPKTPFENDLQINATINQNLSFYVNNL